MVDRFSKQFPNIDSVAFDAFSITPSSNPLPYITRKLYVGVTGNVCIQMASYNGANSIVTFANVPAGTVLPVRATIVFANSTASSILGLI